MIRYNPKGLTTPQIDESRRRHGDNVITPPKDDSAWRLLLEKFRDPIIRILLLAAVLSLIIGFVHKDFTDRWASSAPSSSPPASDSGSNGMPSGVSGGSTK